MKNYSSHNVSPDQVKEMISEIDQRQTEEIKRLSSISVVHSVVLAISLVLGISCAVQLASINHKLDTKAATQVVAPTEAASK